VDPGRYAAALSRVAADAREDGRGAARAGLPRLPHGIPQHFLGAWLHGYDEEVRRRGPWRVPPCR
jgi:hypothetical protein